MSARGEPARPTRAAVWKKGRLAAHLERSSGEVHFAYDPAYLAAAGPPVATSLPTTPGVRRTVGGALPPFFTGLLPEGRRLTNLVRALKASADDELSLLLAVGGDTVGDVVVLPEGQPPREVAPLVEVRRAWNEVRFRDVLAEAGIVDPVGLPGVQEKASARMISLPVARAHERYVLKLDPPEFPHLVENEMFFYGLALEAGLPAAEAEIVVDAEGRTALLVRRFDRVRGPEGLPVSLACEDACQVLERYPADKYNLSAEDVVRGLAAKCAARAPAARALYQQLLFAWLTGNGDLHAKNASILEGPPGEWRVSPAYDLPSSGPYGDRSMALPVQGRTQGLSRRHWLDFAGEVGLPARGAEHVLAELLAATAPLLDRLRGGALPFAPKPTHDWISDLRNRRRQAGA